MFVCNAADTMHVKKFPTCINIYIRKYLHLALHISIYCYLNKT